MSATDQMRAMLDQLMGTARAGGKFNLRMALILLTRLCS